MTDFSKYNVFFFDFDGVILDSVNVKTIAFRKLFEPFGKEIQNQVVEYHLAHGGVSRYEKFRHLYRNLLQRDITDEMVEKLDTRMNQITMKEIMKVDFIPGMPAFLENHYREKECYILSATPQEEIREIVRLRDLERYFRGVFGSPVKKGEHMKKILTDEGYSPSTCVMFGDASSDEEAAVQNMVDFIGIGYPSAVTIPDFLFQSSDNA